MYVEFIQELIYVFNVEIVGDHSVRETLSKKNRNTNNHHICYSTKRNRDDIHYSRDSINQWNNK